MIKDSNSSIPLGQPLYLGRTLSPMALAIFSVVTLYTISNMNVVIGDEGVNDRAALPSDDEEEETDKDPRRRVHGHGIDLDN